MVPKPTQTNLKPKGTFQHNKQPSKTKLEKRENRGAKTGAHRTLSFVNKLINVFIIRHQLNFVDKLINTFIIKQLKLENLTLTSLNLAINPLISNYELKYLSHVWHMYSNILVGK